MSTLSVTVISFTNLETSTLPAPRSALTPTIVRPRPTDSPSHRPRDPRRPRQGRGRLRGAQGEHPVRSLSRDHPQPASWRRPRSALGRRFPAGSLAFYPALKARQPSIHIPHVNGQRGDLAPQQPADTDHDRDSRPINSHHSPPTVVTRRGAPPQSELTDVRSVTCARYAASSSNPDVNRLTPLAHGTRSTFTPPQRWHDTRHGAYRSHAVARPQDRCSQSRTGCRSYRGARSPAGPAARAPPRRLHRHHQRTIGGQLHLCRGRRLLCPSP